ncbi:MAG: hypothetical protein IPK17_19130 [Chloroflexi bacterium]|uniref:hypothetical protein n=1 Tax=Candidatus Flexifilum breve TaxID=3140694 RepID=UPI003136FAA1|nr:hypothetical protein [Chloroflexota bacterium]
MTDVEAWLTACANAAVIEVADGAWRFAHESCACSCSKRSPERLYRETINRQIAEGIGDLQRRSGLCRTADRTLAAGGRTVGRSRMRCGRANTSSA